LESHVASIHSVARVEVRDLGDLDSMDTIVDAKDGEASVPSPPSHHLLAVDEE
jgi:hypothetical protein